MKKYGILFVSLFIIATVSAQRPQYDEAKHFQWRSMEAGPWKFKPKWYYYKWHLFDNPLGMGFHQNYINKHTPNIEQRTPTMALSVLNDSYYNTEKEKVEELHDREMLLQADRTINLINPVMKDKINDSKNRFLFNYNQYCSISGTSDMDKQGYLLNEYLRIMENLKIIKDAYIENSKRQEVYVSVSNEIDKLNEITTMLLRFAENKRVNKGFFE